MKKTRTKKAKGASTTAGRAASIETLLIAAVRLLGELLKALAPKSAQRRRARKAAGAAERGSSKQDACSGTSK